MGVLIPLCSWRALLAMSSARSGLDAHGNQGLVSELFASLLAVLFLAHTYPFSFRLNLSITRWYLSIQHLRKIAQRATVSVDHRFCLASFGFLLHASQLFVIRSVLWWGAFFGSIEHHLIEEGRWGQGSSWIDPRKQSWISQR